MTIGLAEKKSDQFLMARIVSGDETALAALYDRHYGLVYTIAARITNDHAVAEEVMQDVFHAVWRTAGGFQDNGSVAAWIVGIARHRAIDATRTRTFRARGREQSLEPAGELAADNQPHDYVVKNFVSERVRTALAMLPDVQRHALELVFYLGLSQSEVASRTGAPLGTVKTRLRLGMLHLRRALGETTGLMD